MRFNRSFILRVPFMALFAVSALAQDVGRVSPANVPLPLPTVMPVAPNVLRGVGEIFTRAAPIWVPLQRLCLDLCDPLYFN